MKDFFIKYKNYIIGVLVILGVLLLDVVTKQIAVKHFPLSGSLEVIPSFFYLVQHHNFGVAWSSFEGNGFVLYVVPLLALALFVWLFLKVDFNKIKFYSISISLIIGGTLGNFIDRLSRGYVVDFLSFHFGSYQYPTFNVADTALVIGVIMFCIDMVFFEGKRAKKNSGDNV